MTAMSFDEFVTSVFDTAGLGHETIAYKGAIQVLAPTDRGRILVQEPAWCFAERDAAGQWNIDRHRTEDLYLMARWITSAWGRNTTGEGALQAEAEKDLLSPVCVLLDKVCPPVTWAQAGKPFREITAGTLSEQGSYEETIGDGVLEEYDFTYAYRALRLRLLYRWLIENGLLAGESV